MSPVSSVGEKHHLPLQVPSLDRQALPGSSVPRKHSRHLAGRIQSNGHSERIGAFTVTSFDGEVLVAGCHRIQWQEILSVSDAVLGSRTAGGSMRVQLSKERKITPSDLTPRAQRLLLAGKMPSLDELLTVVASTRKKFAPKIITLAEKQKFTSSEGTEDQ